LGIGFSTDQRKNRHDHWFGMLRQNLHKRTSIINSCVRERISWRREIETDICWVYDLFEVSTSKIKSTFRKELDSCGEGKKKGNKAEEIFVPAYAAKHRHMI
jgi:hypothetical protein